MNLDFYSVVTGGFDILLFVMAIVLSYRFFTISDLAYVKVKKEDVDEEEEDDLLGDDPVPFSTYDVVITLLSQAVIFIALMIFRGVMLTDVININF